MEGFWGGVGSDQKEEQDEREKTNVLPSEEIFFLDVWQ